MKIELGKPCSLTPDCDGTFAATIEMAAHDDNLLDIVVACDECDRKLNSFLALDDMPELEN